jgi:hypothetical protein
MNLECQVFKVAARDEHEVVVNAAFEMTEKLIRDHFNLTTEALPELVDALVAIGHSQFTDLALQSLAHLARCAQVLITFIAIGLALVRFLILNSTVFVMFE